jgi:hypothetical protein
MNRNQKITILSVMIVAIGLPIVYPAPVEAQVPYYHIQAQVQAMNSTTTQSDAIRVSIRTPDKPAGMFRTWSYETLEGGLNDTLNGTNSFRFTWEVEVRFVVRNQSYWTGWYTLENENDQVMVWAFSSSGHNYILEARAVIHHWEAELVYYPMTLNMEANIKNE